MYDYETLDQRLIKSWIAAYKKMEKRPDYEDDKEWWKEALKLRKALFTSRDEDAQAVLDKLWESVVV